MPQDDTVQEIDAATALGWVRAGEAMLVDVRSAGEFAAAHAPGAINVPLGQLSPKTLPPGEKSKVVLICASGMRSSAGCDVLAPHEVDAYSVKGGMSAWRRAGGHVEASPAGLQAAARQGKLMAGALVAFGLMLAVLVHPGFLVLTAIAAAQLFKMMRLAPQTGSCSTGGPGQTACSTPDARGKSSGCGNCGARAR